MFGWLETLIDRLAEALFRRGQVIAGTADRATEERRAAIRTVREAISESMTHAEHDREHGSVHDRDTAIAAANRAGATVTEVDDDEARQLVATWKARWNAIPKGRKADHTDPPGRHYVGPVGYPERDWDELRASAEVALERLGVVPRGLLERPK